MSAKPEECARDVPNVDSVDREENLDDESCRDAHSYCGGIIEDNAASLYFSVARWIFVYSTNKSRIRDMKPKPAAHVPAAFFIYMPCVYHYISERRRARIKT